MLLISFEPARMSGFALRAQASDGDLISEFGSELEVVVDRWSAGHIGLTDIVIALTVVVVAVLGAWVTRRFFRRTADRLEGPAATASLLGGQVASAGIYLFGAGLVLEIMGFSLGPIIVLVVVAVVVMLLLEPVVRNLSAGLLLQLRSPFRPGDIVETNQVLGTVEEVNTRTVVLATNDGRTVHIPNRQVLDEMLINYSSLGGRRSELVLRLVAGADVDDVCDRLHEALTDVGHMLQSPPPTISVSGFDGSQLCLKVLFWHPPQLSAERIACDRVARAAAAALGPPASPLADPAIMIRSPRAVDGTGQST